MNVPAQAPHLHRLPLVVRASRSHARSPWEVVASYAVSVRRLAVSFCASLTAGRLSPLLRLAVLSGSLRPTRPEDFHLLFMPMLGTHDAPRSKLRGITELNFEDFSEAEANPVASYGECSSSCTSRPGRRCRLLCKWFEVRHSRSLVRVNRRVRLSRASGLNVVLSVTIVGQVPANWKALD